MIFDVCFFLYPFFYFFSFLRFFFLDWKKIKKGKNELQDCIAARSFASFVFFTIFIAQWHSTTMLFPSLYASYETIRWLFSDTFKMVVDYLEIFYCWSVVWSVPHIEAQYLVATCRPLQTVMSNPRTEGKRSFKLRKLNVQAPFGGRDHHHSNHSKYQSNWLISWLFYPSLRLGFCLPVN